MPGRWVRGWAGWWCAGLLCLLLGACATPDKISLEGGRQAFDRTGRFALNVTRSNGQPQAIQGGFAFSDNGQRLRLDLANPLGSTLARVEVTSGQAVLTRSNGEQKRASDPNALIAQVLGSPLPVSGLRDWLRGRTGSLPVRDLEKGPEGHITQFEQNGWHVALSRYDALGPRLLRMSRDDADRHITVRLVVDGG